MQERGEIGREETAEAVKWLRDGADFPWGRSSRTRPGQTTVKPLCDGGAQKWSYILNRKGVSHCSQTRC